MDEINATFKGARFTVNPVARKFQAIKLGPVGFDSYGNSGAGAISLAAQGNPKRIILLGYDCQKTGGKAHWHGDHPPRLGNAAQIDRWHIKFAKQAKDLTGIEIINCSRSTALECWPRANLEDVLDDA